MTKGICEKLAAELDQLRIDVEADRDRHRN